MLITRPKKRIPSSYDPYAGRCTVGRLPSTQSDFPSGYVHMFIEDIGTYIVPRRARTDKFPDFALSVNGEQSEKKKALSLLSMLARNREGRETETLSEVFNTLARDLAWAGLIRFEIYADSGDMKKLQLGHIPNKHLYRIPGYFLQIIPKPDRELYGKAYGLVPKAQVWEVSIPQTLGGSSGYLRLLQELRECSGLMPTFYTTALEEGAPPGFFNAVEYSAVRDLRVAEITKSWGWPWRNSSLRGITEFYYFYRTLTLLWKQAILRQHIFCELNALFSRLKIASSLHLSGLPSPQQILQLRNQMALGNLTFGQAYKAVSTF